MSRRDRLVPTGVSAATIEERVAFVRSAAGNRAEQLELSALVQRVDTSGGREVADELVALGLDPEVVDDSPIILVGSPAQLTEKLLALRERLSISYWVVFQPALDAFAPVVAELAGK
jgi:hypothetical protein